MTPDLCTERARSTVPRATALVWIDAAEAVIVRLQGNEPVIERIKSEVPAHHRATGHVRHDPAVRHGGGGNPQTAGEPHRIEHLKRFVADIANRVPPEAELLILGPGSVHEALTRELSQRDAHAGRRRHIACAASGLLTEPQLVARLRGFSGMGTRRRGVGAYCWSWPLACRPSGQAVALPQRVVPKAPRERGVTARRG